MSKKKNAPLVLTILALASMPTAVHAQYIGDLTAQPKEENQEETISPYPKVFSSKISGSEEIENLDKIYNELQLSLWNYAVSDFAFQKKLVALMKPEKFSTTRYAREFEGDMGAAMANLNQNYKDMQKNLADAEKQYEAAKTDLRAIQQNALGSLWDKEIGTFKERSDAYFKMQNEFLNTYRQLVAFILKQGGKYYYNPNTRGVAFYDFGNYHYFGKAIDTMKNLNFQQKKILKQNPPVNVPATYLD